MSKYITWDHIARRKQAASDRIIDREIGMEDGSIPLPLPAKKPARKPLRSLKGGGVTAGDFVFCFLRVDR